MTGHGRLERVAGGADCRDREQHADQGLPELLIEAAGACSHLQYHSYHSPIKSRAGPRSGQGKALTPNVIRGRISARMFVGEVHDPFAARILPSKNRKSVKADCRFLLTDCKSAKADCKNAWTDCKTVWTDKKDPLTDNKTA